MPSSKKKLDANRVRYVYPLLRKEPRFGEIGSGTNAEVTIIDFNNQLSNSYTFVETYDQIPVCVISPEDENVNVYITSLTTTSVTVTGSATFTGKVHLHIYPQET
jgi:hypothetical protein